MATLTVNGTKVKVDDSFLSLPKDQQQAVANRIAASLAAGHKSNVEAAAVAPAAPAPAQDSETAVPPPDLKPGSKEYADWAVAQVKAGKKVPQVSPAPPVPGTDLGSQIAASTASAANAVPIAGPALLGALEKGRAAVQTSMGHPMTPEQVAAETEDLQAKNPTASTIGSVAGTVTPFVLAGTVPVVSTILGLDAGAPLAANIGLGMASQAGISAADAAMRGEDPAVAAGLGAAGGAAGPIVGKVLSSGARGATKLAKVLTGNTPSAAQDLITRAATADARSGNVLSAADEAAAAANNQPLINADRFGTGVRTLARTAANTDPAAKQTLDEAVQGRFLTQNERAQDWVQRNTGAPTDVYAIQQQLDNASQGVNNAAYKTAYTHPDAQSIMTPEIEQLMGSSDFQKAIKSAVKSSNNAAAISGQPPLRNPFVVDPKTGDFRIRMMSDNTRAAVNRAASDLADANMSGDPAKIQMAQDALDAAKSIHTDQLTNDTPAALPSLQFWDQVQRQLRQKASVASRQGKNFDALQMNQMRGQLNGVLDSTVPEFAQARGGAARWFGADDALEAGQKFASADMSDMPGAIDAINKFTPAQKRIFAGGFASSLIDKISRAPDTTNVINQVFGSPRAKTQIAAALGPKASEELEPFLRIENIMQQTRNAVQGGSNTAQQLASMGATGYVGGAAVGGLDPRHWNPQTWGTAAGAAALGRYGARALGKMVDGKVMQETARLLTSNDPTLIQRAVRNAANSQKSLDAIKAIEHGISIIVRGGATAAPQALSQPQLEPVQ